MSREGIPAIRVRRLLRVDAADEPDEADVPANYLRVADNLVVTGELLVDSDDPRGIFRHAQDNLGAARKHLDEIASPAGMEHGGAIRSALRAVGWRLPGRSMVASTTSCQRE